MYLESHKGSYLELFAIMLFFLADKDGKSSRIVAELSVSHSPDGVTITPSSLYLYANLGVLWLFTIVLFFLSDRDGNSGRIECEPLSR